MPRPFADDDNGRLLAMPESYGVVVGDVDGLPPEVALELRTAMAGALKRAGIPASTGPGNRGSYMLTALSEAAPPVGTDLEWALQDADGTVLKTITTSLDLQPEQIEAANRSALNTISEQVVRTIEGGGPGQTPELAGPAAPPQETVPVSVIPVEGAPGDGGEALTRALRAALRAYGLEVARGDIDPDGVLVHGDVEVEPAEAGQEQVDIQWTVRWPDGREVGTVSQSNKIPAGMLDHAWGEVAEAAAEGAASGIVPLVEQVAATGKR